MRQKNKLYCDKCGHLIRALTDMEMSMINSDRKQGTRTNCSGICKKCDNQEISPDKTRVAIYGEGIVHLVASGWNKTFCGLDEKDVKHTSLGMCCNCDKCLKICQDIMDKQKVVDSVKEVSK